MSVSLEHFNPTRNKEFKVDSGKIIIADPYTLGYSQGLEKKIKNITKSNSHGFIPFSHGFLYHVLSREGVEVNCSYAVYKKRKSVRIQREDNSITSDELKDEYKCFFRDYSSFDEFKEDYLHRNDERLINNTTFRLLQHPLFTVYVDNYYLLIGDAEHYSVPESEWISNIKSRKIYEDQILYLPKGSYIFRSLLKEEMLILEKL